LSKRIAVALALVAISTAACGSRWSDEQRAALKRRNTTVQATNSSSSDVAYGSTDTPSGGADTGDGTGTASPGAVSGGQTRTATKNAASATLPCAAPSTAPGVTSSTITVGSISSLSGLVPGLASSSAAAARSYVAYLNSKGGVCGRKIVLKEADDGTDNSQYRSIITELGPKILGIQGGFAIGDVGGADIVEAQKIPGVTLPSNDVLQQVSTIFDINPPYKSLNAVQGKYKWLHDHGATKASVIYLDTDQSRLEAKNHISLIKAAGIQVVNEQPLPVSTLSYDSAARNVANSGADYMLFVGTVDANISMSQSLTDTGYKLKWPEYFIFSYETTFLAGAKANAEGAVTFIRYLPNEEGAKNAESARFVEWMGRIAPGEAPDSFAADSWAASKAFYDSLEALPGPITREGLVNVLKNTKSFAASGMFGPIELSGERSNNCVVGLQVVNGQWKRLTPATGFLC
jgi:ABC-type branched-subunit amino acid transport system substrate-binding protein